LLAVPVSLCKLDYGTPGVATSDVDLELDPVSPPACLKHMGNQNDNFTKHFNWFKRYWLTRFTDFLTRQ